MEDIYTQILQEKEIVGYLLHDPVSDGNCRFVIQADHREDNSGVGDILRKNSAYRNELSCRPGRRPKRLRNRQLYILQGLPQIGPKLAGELLDHFGNVEKVFTASAEELSQIAGIGSKKAEKFEI